MFHSLKNLLGMKPKSTKKAKKAHRRTFRPMVDSLEDRRMMAVLFVDDNLQQFPSAQFTSIQAAVNAAQPGDVVTVFAGKYNESVTIPADKPRLTIQGASAGPAQATNPQIASIVDPVAGTGGIGFNVLANDTLIRGFTIGDIDDNTLEAVGVRTDSTVSGFAIVGNVIQDNSIGVYLHASGARLSAVAGNWIRENNDTGAAGGNGIYADQGSNNILVASNIITDQTNAAILFTTVAPEINSALRIEGNVVGDAARVGSGAEILLINTTNSNITGNVSYHSNSHGIDLGGGTSNITIQSNLVLSAAWTGINVNTVFGPANTTALIITNIVNDAGDSGIRLRNGTTSSIVYGNSVTAARGADSAGLGNGVAIENSNSNVVVGNTLNYNASNGVLVTGSTGNVIAANTALFNGNGVTTFDLNEASVVGANLWFTNTARTRSRPGL